MFLSSFSMLFLEPYYGKNLYYGPPILTTEYVTSAWKNSLWYSPDDAIYQPHLRPHWMSEGWGGLLIVCVKHLPKLPLSFLEDHRIDPNLGHVTPISATSVCYGNETELILKEIWAMLCSKSVQQLVETEGDQVRNWRTWMDVCYSMVVFEIEPIAGHGRRPHQLQRMRRIAGTLLAMRRITGTLSSFLAIGFFPWLFVQM